MSALLRDKTRPPGTPRLPLAVAERVVTLTLCDPPSEMTHWTGRLMAKVAGVGPTSVQRIWKAYGLAPHRFRAFKLSNDPKFAAKVRDIVGLYVDPSAHAVVVIPVRWSAPNVRSPESGQRGKSTQVRHSREGV